MTKIEKFQGSPKFNMSGHVRLLLVTSKGSGLSEKIFIPSLYDVSEVYLKWTTTPGVSFCLTILYRMTRIRDNPHAPSFWSDGRPTSSPSSCLIGPPSRVYPTGWHGQVGPGYSTDSTVWRSRFWFFQGPFGPTSPVGWFSKIESIWITSRWFQIRVYIGTFGPTSINWIFWLEIV